MDTPDIGAPVVPSRTAAPAQQATPEPGTSWILPISIAGGLILIVGAAVAAYFLLFASAPQQATAPKLVRIGLTLDTLKIQRWADERDIMAAKAQKMGATVTTLSAEGDDATQIAQIENFIAQKMDVIIVVAHDAAAVAPVISEAQKAGIKVIDYDRLTSNGTPDLYLSFDSVKVGQIAAKYVVDAIPTEKKVPRIAYVGGSTTDKNSYYVLDGAMGVLKPLEKDGKLKIVYNEFTKDWSPSEAYANFKKFLDGGDTVDGVVTAYDGLAYGVVQALAEHHLDGKVPVSGQNGELQAIQRIVQGTQTVTAYKPGKPLAEKTIEAAVDFANGKKPETNGTINNGTADIKAYLFDPIPVTKDNVRDTVIKDGTFTEAQVYGKSAQ